MYLVERKSQREIGSFYNVSQPTLRRWLDRYDISSRGYTENVVPTRGLQHHTWGPQIREALLGNPNVGQGNKGRFGENAPNWRGGTKTGPGGRVFVWSSMMKRYLPNAVKAWLEAHPGEIVGNGYVIHHIDGDPSNDSPDNLTRLSVAQHIALHRKQEREYIKTLQRLLDEAGIAYPPIHDQE
jgi:hypothetical protein